MPDRLEIEIQVRNLAQSVGQLSQLASTAGQLGSIAGLVGAGGAAAGGVAGAASVLAITLLALGAAVETTRRNFQAFSQLQAELRSSVGTTQALRILGAAMGVDAGSAASALRQQANFSPLGRMAGASLGIPFNPYDLTSAADLGKMLLDAIKSAHQKFLTDPAAARLAIANLPALQPFAPVIESMRDLTPLVEEMVKGTSGIYSQENRDAVTEFNLRMAATKQAFTDLTAVIGLPLIQALNRILEWAVKVTETRAPPFSPAFGGQPGSGGHQATMSANTAAVQANTRAIENIPGMWGGGPRADAAIPRAFRGALGSGAQGGWQYLKGNAARLGAYSIGM